jgi:hypothetical protein
MSFLPDPRCCLPLGGGFDGGYVSHCNAIRHGYRLKLRRACHPGLRTPGGMVAGFLRRNHRLSAYPFPESEYVNPFSSSGKGLKWIVEIY